MELGEPESNRAKFYGHWIHRGNQSLAVAHKEYLRLPPIHFDVVDSPEFNAAAFKSRGRYFIGFNAGVAYILNAVISRMLCDPRVMPHVGDPTREEVARAVVQHHVLDAAALHTSGVDLSDPICPIRKQFVWLVSQYAFDFLFFHELAHILNGHVDYYASRSNHPFLEELGWSAGSHDEAIIRQVIEADADNTAAKILINNLFEVATHPQFSPSPPWAQFYQSFQHALGNWYFAVGVLFGLFGDGSFAGTDLSRSQYPPMRVRQMSAVNQAVGYMLHNDRKMTDREVYMAAVNGFHAAEHALSMLRNSEMSATGLFEAWNGSADAHLRDVLEARWKSHLRDELSIHAYRSLSS